MVMELKMDLASEAYPRNIGPVQGSVCRNCQSEQEERGCEDEKGCQICSNGEFRGGDSDREEQSSL